MSDLTFAAQVALKGSNPRVAWDQVQHQVFQAFEEYPDQAQKLMEKYQPPYDQMNLDLTLQNLEPEVGLNNLEYLNKKVNLQNPLKSPPLDVLEEVLRMVTESDKWQTEVLI